MKPVVGDPSKILWMLLSSADQNELLHDFPPPASVIVPSFDNDFEGGFVGSNIDTPVNGDADFQAWLVNAYAQALVASSSSPTTFVYDPAKTVNYHVRWQLLSSAEQADLLANYPLQPGATAPAAGVFGDDVDPRFQQWLDSAYLARHVADTIINDPFF